MPQSDRWAAAQAMFDAPQSGRGSGAGLEHEQPDTMDSGSARGGRIVGSRHCPAFSVQTSKRQRSDP
jgi:hypothetical protein